jgi:hypothetical protein
LRLVHHFESDPAVADAGRVMRLPGSRSYKTGRVARLESFTGEAHALDDVTGWLDDAPSYVSGAGPGRGEHQAPAERVRYGKRDRYLLDVGLRFLRGGFLDEGFIAAHLEREFKRRCVLMPPPPRGYFERMAGSLLRTRIAGRKRDSAEQRGNAAAFFAERHPEAR